MNPAKAAVSNAYMDANGIGKVITISEAVFQALPKNTSNISCGGLENLPGGCPCTRYGAYRSLMRHLFCITWSRLVKVQICHTVSHNVVVLHCACVSFVKLSHLAAMLLYIMTHHVILSHYVILCHTVSCATLRLTQRLTVSRIVLLCVTSVFKVIKMQSSSGLQKNLNVIVNFPNRITREAVEER